MAYQAHHGPGDAGYQPGGGGPNEAYFDKSDDDSPFEHYKDNQYDKNDDNPLDGDYNKAEEEEQKKEEGQKGNTLIDNIKKEEQKAKKDGSVDNVPKKAADEIMHGQLAVRGKQENKPKKTKAHKSIEEAIKDASKDKKEVFVLE